MRIGENKVLSKSSVITVAVVLSVVSVIAVFSGIDLTYKTIKFTLTHPKTQGLIVDVVQSAENENEYLPKVSFFNSKNQIITFTPKVAPISFLMPKINDKVEVYYDENNPNSVLINTLGTAWFLPVGALLLGLMVLGQVLFIVKRYRDQVAKQKKEMEALQKMQF